jgi:hypothetical protein
VFFTPIEPERACVDCDSSLTLGVGGPRCIREPE